MGGSWPHRDPLPPSNDPCADSGSWCINRRSRSAAPVTGDPVLNATTGLPSSSLGLEGVATAYYGNPRQIFATLGFSF